MEEEEKININKAVFRKNKKGIITYKKGEYRGNKEKGIRENS